MTNRENYESLLVEAAAHNLRLAIERGVASIPLLEGSASRFSAKLSAFDEIPSYRQYDAILDFASELGNAEQFGLLV